MTAQEYLAKHGLSETFVKEKLGWNWNEEAISIPVYNQSGKLLYNKYRHLNYEENQLADVKSSKFSFDKGGHPALYCIHKVAKADWVILCEGEPDAAQLWQNKIPAVTSTGGVGKFDPVMAQMLVGKEVFVCLDTDKAGQEKVMDAVRTLMEAGIKAKVVDLPHEVKDVCEYIASGKTADDFLGLVKEALTGGEWWSLHKPEDFTIVKGDELLATEFPPNRWLINRVLPKEGFAFFFAAEASYKTFITLDMALCVAAGKKWLDQDEFEVETSGKVLFIDKENPLEMIKRRIQGLGYTPDVAKNVGWVKYPEKLQLVNEDGSRASDFMMSLADEVRENGVVLVVIDSFVDLMVGNENAADDTQMFFNILKECFPGICVATLHHENKPSQGTFRSDAQRTRGSSNINAQCSVMFRLELAAKSKTEVTIKQTKARDAQKLDKFLVEARIESGEDGKTFVAGFDYKGVVADTAEDKVGEAQAAIEEMFSASPTLSRQDILDTLAGQGISRSTVDRAVKKMTDDGIIDAIPDPANKRKKNYILMDMAKNQ